MKKVNFEGVITALVTPFLDGNIDFESLKKLVRQQLDGGVEGFVVCGSTAEAATLAREEKFELLKFVLGEVPSDFPVIFGAGTNNTQESCELAQQAEKLGARGLLTVVPYYNKPPQRGMEAHFKKIAQSTGLPILLYNVPGRTIAALSPETTAKLAQVQNIVGIKEATGEIPVMEKFLSAVPKSFLVTSGDDPTFAEAILKGARGVISVVSHLIPQSCRKISDLARAGNAVEARAYFKKVEELCSAIFVETNPMPVKMGLYKMGVIRSPECRLPLVTMDEALVPKLLQVMKHSGVSL